MVGIAHRVGHRGFTLIELLTVVAIIVLLTTIAVPNVLSAMRKAQLRTTEANIESLKTGLELYRQAFGGYPGDVFPSEDVNNDGVLDTAEDIGVDIDGDGTQDYALTPNSVIDAGDGVVNIQDLEWALRTSARGGPFIDDFPLDAWGQDFVYSAPMTRPGGDSDFLYLNPAAMVDEDTNGNGILDTTEDLGIALYATSIVAPAFVDPAFGGKRAGAGNGILDHGDDDNTDGAITYEDDGVAQPNTQIVNQWELGNQDISPDGFARNRGYYIYSIGIDGVDNSHSGYEDITGDQLLTAGATFTGVNVQNAPAGNTEDRDPDGAGPLLLSTDLDTGYEDTGLDGRANTHDSGEEDGALSTGAGNTTEEFDGDGELDIGGDDINSWNENKPWRQADAYN